ncbi:amylo-alpha-1,6-glucosidase [Micromonospora sp. KC723]|uniref:amylo-alpha-1,6-glucosidase n=1 Tax=Micromonospora sp. KC723 TaxID=2530381 RepID=UPI0010439C97|nr:glycogen debranching protein [Micromonospora sp. KC723]TDB76250.1 glycogen debranching protein [Micromonospora sp. KC723]
MPVAPPGPQFSVRDIPFSHRGSWFDFSPVIAEKTYADDVHLVSHQTGLHPVLRLVPHIGGNRVEASLTAVPSRLTWTHAAGRIELAYESADTVRVRGAGLGLRVVAAAPVLTPFSGAYFLRDPVDGSYLFTLYETGRRYRITVLSGPAVTVDGAQDLGTADRGISLADSGAWEVAIEEYDNARPPYRVTLAFDRVAEAAATDFAEFVGSVAPWRTDHTPAAELAAYVLWSATVRPAGFVTRSAVLMSKHWMDKVWSWDHCFNALALASGLPDLAWDQFHLPFEHQDTSGALPDSVTHSEVLYNFVKPPIHGWALRRLRQRIPVLTHDELLEAYRRLECWTRFWLTARRVPGQALAHYQHGNDSGWDNATTFDPQRVVESADLASFLVLQMRELADLARHLGCADQASSWAKEADQMRAALLELWTGQEFVTRAAGSRRAWTSASLLDLMPIVLADELPDPIRQVLADRIKSHLTPHGLATELPTSPHYQADGYWRGPIWAPATVLIEDGLRRSGFTGLADEVSNRFRALCEQSGFAENFDALTGAGLRDRAYTWTASGYLILAAAYEHRRPGAGAGVQPPRPEGTTP